MSDSSLLGGVLNGETLSSVHGAGGRKGSLLPPADGLSFDIDLSARSTTGGGMVLPGPILEDMGKSFVCNANQEQAL